MPQSLARLLEALQKDPWRDEVGFSADLAEANDAMFEAGIDKVPSLLADWLGKFQPCLFGRIAAKRDLLSYCVLDESDLVRGDAWVGDAIQEARLRWTSEGFRGQRSGFVILLRSRRIALAKPGPEMMAFAQRLASLYLLVDVQPDFRHLDELFLEIPGRETRVWRWLAGVNYFSSQGDRRWWQDHRVPAGMALSINSVGHMVHSGLLARAMSDLSKTMGTAGEEGRLPPVDSLPKALDLAMRTIDKAALTEWGRATELLPLPQPNDLPVECPAHLPEALANKNYCEYAGYYDTDQTLPTVYFSPDASRSPSIASQTLDFTYLYRRSVDNPDHDRMGRGVRIRTSDASQTREPKAEPIEIDIGAAERLRAALRTGRDNGR